MTLDAVRPEGYEHLRLLFANDAHDLAHCLALVGNGQLAIHIVQEERGMDAVDLAGAAQFLLTHHGQVGRAGEGRIRDLAGLSTRGGHQVNIAAFRRIACESAADALGLVTRMGKDGQ